MRHSPHFSRHRLLLAAVMLPLGLTLAGCESGGFWDGANSVSDKFQDAISDFSPFGTGKKPLPGERRAVFPEGVPGVQQGVPRELVRGNPQQALEEAPPAPPPEPASKSKAKKTASKSKAPSRSQSGAQPDDEVWPPPPSR
jgi:hypothetical protein